MGAAACAADADLADLPELRFRTVGWNRGGRVPEGHVVDGSESSFLTALFDYEAEVSPSVAEDGFPTS